MSRSSSLKLRPLEANDAEVVSHLENEIFGGEAWSATQVDEELTNPWSTYIGAEVGGQLVGYAGVKGDSELDVMTIGVLPDFRGQGIGSRLLEALTTIAGERDLFLEVRESNRAAVSLYEAAGFVTIGRIRGYYRSPLEDAITMCRKGPIPHRF